MKLQIPKDIKFSHFYKKLNILSLILVFLSILILSFNGLNLGVDFKGGTLIELRIENSATKISEIRQSFLKMNLGDVNVKKFGKVNDYLIKIENTNSQDDSFIISIKESSFVENFSSSSFKAETISINLPMGTATLPSSPLFVSTLDIMVCSKSEVFNINVFFFKTKTTQLKIGRVVLIGSTLL